MTVRPFDWRDLSVLHRNRDKSVYLDSVLVLTRGPLVVPGALFSTLAPAMGVFTCVTNGAESEQPVIGQLIHLAGSQVAHLTFLTPETALEQPSTTELLDYMVTLCGERSAWRLLADVDEQSPAFEAMRHNGFAIYARQRNWLAAEISEHADEASAWRPAGSQDAAAIRSLYSNLVPGLVQQVEPFSNQSQWGGTSPKGVNSQKGASSPKGAVDPKGLVYYEKGELLAFVEFKSGHRGFWVQPYVHPDAENVAGMLASLLQKIPGRRSRPVYICVRSYQAWLEAILEDLGAQPGASQAVMVKYMVQPLKAGRTFTLPSLENGHAEVSTPIAQSESK